METLKTIEQDTATTKKTIINSTKPRFAVRPALTVVAAQQAAVQFTERF
jgi:hypothetical protein